MVQNLLMHQTLHYCLMNDIPIDNENVFELPIRFTGSITSSSERTAKQYMIQRLIRFSVYNRYQLEIDERNLRQRTCNERDYIAEKLEWDRFLHWEDGSLSLLYSKTHNYKAVSSFTTETPELLANKADRGDNSSGVITSAYPSDYEGKKLFRSVVKRLVIKIIF